MTPLPADLLAAGAQARQVGPYKLLGILGQGGMGVVYAAEQVRPLRRRVALKLIKLGMDTREVLARFESERQALALMSHPHIARVYDAGSTESGRRYASASELAADIYRYLRHEPVSASPTGLAYRLRRRTFRHRKVILSVLVSAVLVATTAAVGRGLATAKLLTEGLEHRDRHLKLRSEIIALEERWTRERETLEKWRPVWERGAELEAWRELEEARSGIGVHFDQAALSFQKGLAASLPFTSQRHRVREALEALYFERYREALERGELRLGPEFFKALVESVGLGTYKKSIEEGRLTLTSDPPAADVYCFRYVLHEARLVPLPFSPAAWRRDPAAGCVGEPLLEVEWVDDGTARRPPFAVGDRLLELSGRALRGRGDFVEAIRGVAEGAEVRVKVRRRGEEVVLAWRPHAATRGGGAPGASAAAPLVSLRDELGVDFAGYPIELAGACRLGAIEGGAPLVVDLPRGSYLFVFVPRLAGYREARLPVAEPAEQEPEKERSEHVILLRDADFPPGFVYVPAGSVSYGGDPGVDEEGLERGTRRIEAFFMARQEVTVAEYLEFVNDPKVLASTRDEQDPTAAAAKALRIIPYHNDGPFFRFDAAEEKWRAGELEPDWPVFGVHVAAASAYAEWLGRATEKRLGRRWRFRLPSDSEWEKAARGADRRFYVWGDYFLWSCCLSLYSSPSGKSLPVAVAIHPDDESVFGVRDMIGSVCEPTTGRTSRGYTSIRGGDWKEPNGYSYRVTNRLGRMVPYGTDQGIRLAADLPE